jgi:tetratricopeptide (TPR) repeat protein
VRISAQLIRVDDGLHLWSETYDREVHDVFAVQEEIARAVAGSLKVALLGERTAAPSSRGTNDDAYIAYLQGRYFLERRSQENMGRALGYFEQAIKLDPDFALAHARLADAQAVDGGRARAMETYARAARLAADVSMRERYLITARLHTSRQEYERAAESLRALVGLYPDDLAAHQELALAYENIGQRPRAIAELRECVRLDPNGTQAWGNLILLLATESREDEALGTYDQARARQLDSPYFGWGVGLARLGRGELADARAAFERMQESISPYDSWGRFYRARLDAYEGRHSQALAQLAQDSVLHQDRRNKTFEILSRSLRSHLLWERGQAAEARRELDLVLGESDEALWPAELRNAGVLLARMNALPEARRVLARLERQDGAATAVGRSCLRTIEGEIALAEKRPEDARRAFLLASSAYPHPASLQGLARVEEHQRHWPAAAEAWQKVVEARGAVLRFSAPSDWAFAHLQRARALRAAGNLDEARREYGVFEALWRNADPSPLGDQARRELKSLDKPVKRP